MRLRTFLELFFRQTDSANASLPVPRYTAEKRDVWLSGLLSEIPQERQTEPLRRKVAAKAVHGFLLEVLGLPDEDWGEAAKLADIYECKVCANAIAQTIVRGIMKPVSGTEFGGNLPLEEAEAEAAAMRVCELLRAEADRGG